MNGEKLTVIRNDTSSPETLILGCSVLWVLLCSMQVGPNHELYPSSLRICLPQRNSLPWVPAVPTAIPPQCGVLWPRCSIPGLLLIRFATKSGNGLVQVV